MANLSAEVLNIKFNGGGLIAVVDKCSVCPFRGDCTPCKPKAIISSGVLAINSERPLAVVGKVGTNRAETTGRPYFKPVDNSVKTCFQCAKNLDACTCTARRVD